MNGWEPIGEVVITQVHLREIVHDGMYDARHLRPVEALWVTPNGVVGLEGGAAVLDFHHRDHPEARRFNPGRLLSIGFTSHYDAMRDEFGDLPEGIGAENVVVRSERIFREEDVSAGIRFANPSGEPVDLVGAAVARPCVPFTRFLLGEGDWDDELVAAKRRFLQGGMRGFVMGLAYLDGGAALFPGAMAFRKV